MVARNGTYALRVTSRDRRRQRLWGGETIEAGEKNEKSCRITEVFTHNFCYTSALPYGILMVSGLRRMRRPRWAERRTNWMGLIF